MAIPPGVLDNIQANLAPGDTRTIWASPQPLSGGPPPRRAQYQAILKDYQMASTGETAPTKGAESSSRGWTNSGPPSRNASWTWPSSIPPTRSRVVIGTWNLPGTPTFYVLDHQGLIRHKWVGSPADYKLGGLPDEKDIDAALEKLIKAAEADQKKAPK